MGIDIGFSTSRASTGVAWYTSGRFGVHAVKSGKAQILDCLPKSFCADVAALDGPLVPNSKNGGTRYAERCLARGAFQRRCKPAFSHFGTGYALRKATRVAASQIRDVVKERSLRQTPFSFARRSIVEAFPNAFLGVILDDDVYEKRPHLKRGQKFDWLYERAMEERVIDKLVSHIGFAIPGLLDAVQREEHHEKRAAHICLLTAACVAANKLTGIGDEHGGWIILPPLVLWANWSRKALDESERALAISY